MTTISNSFIASLATRHIYLFVKLGNKSACQYYEEVKHKNYLGLLYVICFAVFTVVLSYTDANVGLTSFIALVLSLGIEAVFIMVRMWISLLRLRPFSVWSLLFAVPLTIGYLYFTLLLTLFVVDHITSGLAEAYLGTGLEIFIYMLAYTLPQLHLLRSKQNGLRTYSISAVAIFYALLVCLFAGVAFADPSFATNTFHTVLLVLAIQLQFVMNYIVTNTAYLERIYPLSLKIHSFTPWKDEASASNMAIALGAMPFLFPFVIIAMVNSIS